ncbi:hypothetical protein Dacet_0696 [Denitrovibrio acetiphilus DSM 12809]|uniref:Lipoprotein n=1 Tax=Denitrovibrio acetiphilus (strain DSM 12809 / NBRC 114555 / N2460) TaxID=522772 RepID=D4H4T8_DENA2|nr:hypothetical protein [Denitrovibrio acetiphilus]ADD67482.1 hypothetical protein Dacet_0696 [Denitrovibrio acetiphilus DSM 12809]
MHNRIILAFTMFVVFLVLTACGGGGGSSVSTMEGTTPINLSDRDTLYGTYQVTFMATNCSNGISYTTDDDRVDEFTAFVGYGNANLYRDIYLEAEGEVLIDVADITPYEGLDTLDTSDMYQIDSYNFVNTIYNVYEGYYYCNYTYRYRKLSDAIIRDYFRLIRSRSAEQPEGHVYIDSTNIPDFTKQGFNIFKMVID